MATSTMRAPARSRVMVRSSAALPSLTCAMPEASSCGGPVVAELARSHGDVVAGEAACAADLDAQRQRNVGHRRARRAHAPHARVRGRVPRRRDRVDRDVERVAEGSKRRLWRVFRRIVEPAVAHDDDGRGALLRRRGERTNRRPEVASRGACRQPLRGTRTERQGERRRGPLTEPEDSKAYVRRRLRQRLHRGVAHLPPRAVRLLAAPSTARRPPARPRARRRRSPARTRAPAAGPRASRAPTASSPVAAIASPPPRSRRRISTSSITKLATASATREPRGPRRQVAARPEVRGEHVSALATTGSVTARSARGGA